MKVPESKLPKDKKLTADNMISGDQMEKDIDEQMEQITQVMKARKKGPTIMSDVSSILDNTSQNPPSQFQQDGDADQVSDGQEIGLDLDADGAQKLLKLKAAKTDIHVQEKIEAQIDEKNPYRYS